MTPAGNLFVIAAPSGGGKTSLTRALLERERGIRLSVSYTTRAPRPGERDGVDYHFITADRFMALMAGRGIPRARARARQLVRHVGHLAQGRSRRRARRIARNRLAGCGAGARTRVPIRSTCSSCRRRWNRSSNGWSNAGRTTHATIARRLNAARDEIRHCKEFDYVIINQDFASAVDDLSAIVRSARLRGAQQRARYRALIEQLT